VYHANEFYGNAKAPFNAVRDGVAPPPVLLVENKILSENLFSDSTTTSAVSSSVTTSIPTLSQDASACQTKTELELPLWEREVLACRNVQGPANNVTDLVQF
jgi:hypothetical protein